MFSEPLQVKTVHGACICRKHFTMHLALQPSFIIKKSSECIIREQSPQLRDLLLKLKTAEALVLLSATVLGEMVGKLSCHFLGRTAL